MLTIILISSLTAVSAIEKVATPDELAVARHINSLSDSNTEKRSVAAEALWLIVAKYPSKTIYLSSKDGGEGAWQEKADRVELEMPKEEVLKLLPKFTDDGAEIASGDSHYVVYRLDYHWMVRISYRNTDRVIAKPELRRCALEIHPTAPKGYTGTWTTWHVNGQKGYEIQYKDGQYNGVFTHYHDNGNKSYEQHYVNHVTHGPDTGWFEDGRVCYTGQYKDGQQDGRWTHWHRNGVKHNETDYANGKYHGSVTYWHENGQIGSVNDYLDGVKHGREASWDERGKLHYDRIFVNGKIVR